MRTDDSSLDFADTDSERGFSLKFALPSPSQQLLILSFVLAGSGLLVLIAVLTSVYGTFSDLASNKLISEWAKQIATKPLLAGTGAADLRLGEGATQLLAMLFFLLLSGLATFIGVALVRAGVQVVSPQAQVAFTRLQQRVDSQFTGLKERFEELVKRLPFVGHVEVAAPTGLSNALKKSQNAGTAKPA